MFKSYAQDILTQDKISLGNRSKFMENCVKSSPEKELNFNGLTIQIHQYCSCIVDDLIPVLNSKDIENAIEKDSLAQFFLRPKNLEITLTCLVEKYNADVNNKTTSIASEEDINTGIEVCIKGMIEELGNEIQMDVIENYCNCAIRNIFSKGFSLNDLLEMEDENSVVYNEIILDCFYNAFGTSLNLDNEPESFFPEILGGGESSTINLLTTPSGEIKVKIVLNGISKYFIIDTGASDLIINSKLEEELRRKGLMKETISLEPQIYILANGEEILAKRILMNNIEIGDYTVNNTIIGIVDGDFLLCGINFLEKFRKWEINSERSTLKLYK
jgi:clan AA aspartic protease (TIGR02281 family)